MLQCYLYLLICWLPRLAGTVNSTVQELLPFNTPPTAAFAQAVGHATETLSSCALKSICKRQKMDGMYIRLSSKTSETQKHALGKIRPHTIHLRVLPLSEAFKQQVHVTIHLLEGVDYVNGKVQIRHDPSRLVGYPWLMHVARLDQNQTLKTDLCTHSMHMRIIAISCMYMCMSTYLMHVGTCKLLLIYIYTVYMYLTYVQVHFFVALPT